MQRAITRFLRGLAHALGPSMLRLSLNGLGLVRFEHRQGDRFSAVETHFPPPEPGTPLRITLCWNAPKRVGLLAVEDLETGKCSHSIYDAPQPLSMGDCNDLANPNRAKLGSGITALAVSDTVEPIGMMGGIAEKSVIDTPRGARLVETLRPGDEVQTSAHGVQPIRDVVCYEAPSVGSFAPIHLAAPFFGLSRDLYVAQNHRLLVTGADSEYLFGTEEVLIEAHHLARLAEPLKRRRPPTQRYVQILLDAHVCLSVGGGWAESLFLGDLPDHPLRHAMSILADRPIRRLPRHAQIASPQLRPYEAAVLVSSLCA